MPRKKLTEEELEQSRTAIKDAATALFSEQGFKSVTMRSIANQLGWSPMATYKYFDSKDAIFTAVREDALYRLGEAMRCAGENEIDPLERLAKQSRAYVQFGIEFAHEYTLAFEYYAEGMPGFPLMTESSLLSWSIQNQAVEEACEQGRLHGDASMITHMLWLSLHGLIMLHNARRLIFDAGVDALTTEALEMICVRYSAV